jgi:hypothetical protein
LRKTILLLVNPKKGESESLSCVLPPDLDLLSSSSSVGVRTIFDILANAVWIYVGGVRVVGVTGVTAKLEQAENEMSSQYWRTHQSRKYLL